jgi:hypothetical protein
MGIFFAILPHSETKSTDYYGYGTAPLSDMTERFQFPNSALVLPYFNAITDAMQVENANQLFKLCSRNDSSSTPRTGGSS